MGACLSTNDTLSAKKHAEFYKIADNFTTREEVTAALRQQGLESSNLIVAVDFTKSNEWTGKNSNRGKCLHTAPYTGGVSPYEEVMTVIGMTLEEFDDDNLIPCYGFGDVSTADKGLFSFLPNDEPCVGMQSAVQRYREVASEVRLSGPTSFAPAICQAMKVDGQVTSNGKSGALATAQEVATIKSIVAARWVLEAAIIKSIVAASQLPLSIIMVGVGDGPWDMMESFDDLLPQRKFDNFQFVNYTKLALRFANDPVKRDVNFAKDALMEIPEQFKIIQKAGLLGRTTNVATPLYIHPIDPPHPGHPNASFAAYGSNVSRATPSNLPFHYPTDASQASGPAYPPSFQAPAQPPPFQPPPSAPTQYPPFQAPPPSPAQYPPYQAPPTKPAQYPPYQAPPTNPAQYPPFQAPPATPAQYQAPPPAPVPVPTHPSAGSQMWGPGGASASAMEKGPQPNDMFLCPISQAVMADPVIASDGYTYDRRGIEQWLSKKQTSPMTNAAMPSTTLVPNHGLRSSIMEWQQAVGACAQERGSLI
eukprot:gene10749-17826_t